VQLWAFVSVAVERGQSLTIEIAFYSSGAFPLNGEVCELAAELSYSVASDCFQAKCLTESERKNLVSVHLGKPPSGVFIHRLAVSYSAWAFAKAFTQSRFYLNLGFFVRFGRHGALQNQQIGTLCLAQRPNRVKPQLSPHFLLELFSYPRWWQHDLFGWLAFFRTYRQDRRNRTRKATFHNRRLGRLPGLDLKPVSQPKQVVLAA